MEETAPAAQLARAKEFLARYAGGGGVGVVLGSGLGEFADRLDGLQRVPYAEIPFMPTSTVKGHPGNLCVGHAGTAPVVCLQGRVHLYEGRSVREVVFGVRLLAELGCSVVLLTNAAGGIASGLRPGDLMLIRDHMNLTGHNPLLGLDQGPGPRFPDLSHAYDPGMQELARRAARESGVTLREGVYAAMLGPSYETPAEVRMLRTLGADAVGMSTVPEVIALRHRGIRVAAVSCITNLAAGMSEQELRHEEVAETAAQASEGFIRLLWRWAELAFESAA